MKRIAFLTLLLFVVQLVQSQSEELTSISQPDSSETDTSEVFMIVETMPSFNKDGLIGFQKYISQNLKYPSEASDKGIQGTVYIQFIVNKKGEVIEVKIARGVHKSLNNEAMRVVKESPAWQSGLQKGKPVRVRFIFPIKFRLQIEKKKKKKF